MFEKFDDVVTVEELSEMLRIGRNNAYALIKSGEIHSVRIGKQLRIPKAAIIAFITRTPAIAAWDES